ncbi:helix-turn-helix domain-containing protein, partial [Klebsiella pneumoniae]|uniref:helix-turn-helix domain-containing protein n=1 Tax=Klebsiella pneumoniae TaxID=573 RepID=UPI002657640D
IDRNMAESGPLKQFVIPGRNLASAQLHVARTQSRRLERLLTASLTFSAIEKEAIIHAARVTSGRVQEMSQLLNIGRTTLWRK